MSSRVFYSAVSTAPRFLLTAQPQACAGLVLHVVFFFFFNRAAAGVRGSSFARGFFFFLVLSVTWPRPPLGKMLVRIINHETCNV